MASLTGPLNPLKTVRDADVESFQVVDTEVIYRDALVGIYDSTGADPGRIRPYAAGVTGLIPLGIALPHSGANSVTGDTSASPVVECGVYVGETIVMGLPVTGASTVASVGVDFYCGTDNINSDLTLTQTGTDRAVGFISRYNSATSFDVTLYSFSPSASGSGKGLTEAISMGQMALPDITAGVVARFTAPFSGTIVLSECSVSGDTTGSGATMTLTPGIAGVVTTGGAVTPVTGSAIGTRFAGTAITANNTVTAGQIIDVTAAAITPFTTGTVEYSIHITRS